MTKAIIAVTRTRPASRGLPTRQRILDAAEALFSIRGYYGVSLRAIAGEANLDLTNVQYHFKTKEALFEQVLDRRAAHLAQARGRALDNLEYRCSPALPLLEDILEAVILPDYNLVGHGDAGWSNYMRLLKQLSSLPELKHLTNRYLGDQAKRVFILLRRTLPESSEQDVVAGFHFVLAALTASFGDVHRVDYLPGVHLESDTPEFLRERMIPFLCAGLRALNKSR